MNKKVVLITGASSGIGKASAEKFLEKGYIVYGAARNVNNMLDLEKLGAKIIKLDISKFEEIEKSVEQIISEQGRIDILFNNAGFGLYGSIEEVSLEDAQYQFQVNLFGLAKLTQLVIPYMRKQKYGRIINTSSMVGKVYLPLGAWYIASKHALEGWSDCLRLELKPFGINVSLIEPGIIQTEFGNVMTEPMLRTSGNGPYKEIVQKMAKATEKSYSKKSGTSPKVIADLVLHASESDNPKIRYVAGELAKPLLFLRKWFGDKIYDRIILNQVK